MITPSDMAARHTRILTELSGLGLTLARDLQARALAAADVKTASDLALAFHRASRSVRQTMALEARLERDRDRQHADARAAAMREADVLRKARKARVRVAVERLIWTEAEDDEAERLLEDLDALLDLAALAPDFLEGSMETHIARIRHDLGIAAEAPDEQPATASNWRSSG